MIGCSSIEKFFDTIHVVEGLQIIAASNMFLLYEDVGYGLLFGLLKQIFLESGAILPFVELQDGQFSVGVFACDKGLGLLRVRAPTLRENNDLAFSYGTLYDIFWRRHWFYADKTTEDMRNLMVGTG